MARKPRIHYAGAVYHVLIRGNARQQIFFETADYLRFLESGRIGPVLDVVEPRAKEDSQTSAFPGWTGPPGAARHGRTHVLSGMAVAAVGRIAGVQEGIIDMGIEAKPYSPFSRTCNLVLVFEAAEGADRLALHGGIRKSLLRVAERLAALGRSQEPDCSERWIWPPGHRLFPVQLWSIRFNLRDTCGGPLFTASPQTPSFQPCSIPWRCWTGPWSAGTSSSRVIKTALTSIRISPWSWRCFAAMDRTWPLPG